VLVAAMLLAPVPWRHQMGDDPLGLAWRLDGRLSVEGQVVDPPGRWSWLTVGRPPLVAEVLVDLVTPGGSDSQDLRDEPIGYDPGTIEATAAAVGLRAAGTTWRSACGSRWPTRSMRASPPPGWSSRWTASPCPTVRRGSRWPCRAPARSPSSSTTAATHTFAGPALPYETVRVLDVPPDGLDAMLFAWLPDIGIVRWARSLALGPSHGLMVALLTYAHATGRGPGAGPPHRRHRRDPQRRHGHPDRRAAGEGGRREALGSGRAALPGMQAPILAGFDAGEMRLVPVATLSDAIEALSLVDELEPGLPPERSDEVDAEEADPAARTPSLGPIPTVDTDAGDGSGSGRDRRRSRPGRSPSSDG
jgi:hypothetical protein